MKTHILTIVLLMCTAGLYAQNVGIGTDTPLSKLDVRGDLSLNDNRIILRNGLDQNHWIGWIGGAVDGAKIV